MSFVAKLGDCLASPRARIFAALVAVVVSSPSLAAGLALDDYTACWRVNAPRYESKPWDLFSWVDGDPARLRTIVNQGLLPWCAVPGLRVSFFRPLSSLTHWVDYTYWPHSAWWMHAESIATYAVLVLLVASLYRRLAHAETNRFSYVAAGIAAIIYAVNEANVGAVGWLSNRNGVLGALFGVATLLLHDRARREGSRVSAVFAPLVFILGLASCESALATCGYLFAYAVFLDPSRRLRAFTSLAPYAAIVVVWRALYQHFGYGAWGSGMYVDPAREPLAFLRVFPGRVVALLLGTFFDPPPDAWQLVGDHGRIAYACIGAFVLALLGCILWPRIRRDRTLLFFVVGAILAVIPGVAALPSGRLLLFAGVGAAPILAHAIAILFDRESASNKALSAIVLRVLARTLIAIRIVLASVLALAFAQIPRFLDRLLDQEIAPITRTEAIRRQTLVAINTPEIFSPVYGFYVPRDDRPTASAVHSLATTRAPVDVERLDANTIRVTPDGGYFTEPTLALVRGPTHPLHENESVHLDAFDAKVGKVEDDRPRDVTFRFAKPLEDPALRFLAWDGSTFRDFRLPAIGARARILIH